MRATDIETLVSVGRPDIAPDGSFAVFAIVAPRSRGQPRRRPAVARRPARRHAAPPDARHRRLRRRGSRPTDRGSRSCAAMRRARAQIFVVAAGGGEPVQVTDAPLGVEGFAWSPDGASLAFTARVSRKRAATAASRDWMPSAEAPRRITGIRWHANGLGYIADRPAQLFLVAVPGIDARAASTSPPPPLLAEGEQAAEEDAGRRSTPRALTDRARRPTPVSCSTATRVLTVVDEIEHDTRDLRSRLVAVARRRPGAARAARRGASDLSIADVAVADRRCGRRSRGGCGTERGSTSSPRASRCGCSKSGRPAGSPTPRRSTSARSAATSRRSATTSWCRTARAAASDCCGSTRTGDVDRGARR